MRQHCHSSEGCAITAIGDAPAVAEHDHCCIGVTFTGQTDIGAAKDAPSISMLLTPIAVWVAEDSLVNMRGRILGWTCSLLPDLHSAYHSRTSHVRLHLRCQQ
jgi:hypothetical protein